MGVKIIVDFQAWFYDAVNKKGADFWPSAPDYVITTFRPVLQG